MYFIYTLEFVLKLFLIREELSVQISLLVIRCPDFPRIILQTPGEKFTETQSRIIGWNTPWRITLTLSWPSAESSTPATGGTRTSRYGQRTWSMTGQPWGPLVHTGGLACMSLCRRMCVCTSDPSEWWKSNTSICKTNSTVAYLHITPSSN